MTGNAAARTRECFIHRRFDVALLCGSGERQKENASESDCDTLENS